MDFSRPERTEWLHPYEHTRDRGRLRCDVQSIGWYKAGEGAGLIGAVVVERVFVIPGIGSYLVDSVARQDRLAVQGIVVTIVAISLAVSFVVDVAYTVVDPRLRRR